MVRSILSMLLPIGLCAGLSGSFSSVDLRAASNSLQLPANVRLYLPGEVAPAAHIIAAIPLDRFTNDDGTLVLNSSEFATREDVKPDGTALSTSQYDTIVRYTKFAAAVYNRDCLSPVGATLITKLADDKTDTHGFVARDDSTKEIILSFKGTSGFTNVLTDAGVALAPCVSPGVPYPANAQCHTGFQESYNSVASAAIASVKQEVEKNPDYSIVVVGHSLGGALCSFGAISMKQNFPKTNVTAYSFGQPRTGDVNYARFHDASFPMVKGKPTYFRSEHEKDGVPQVIRTGASGNLLVTAAGLVAIQNDPKATTGYRHHGTEIWQRSPDGASAALLCKGQENPTCQDSVYIFAPLFGITMDHLTYYGITVGNPNPFAANPYCAAAK